MNLFSQKNRAEYEKEIISLRRLFHKIPEICYQEEKTAEKIE